ncbi:hypothetical protein [Lactococcus sp.]|uniref:hypothetical protein n=1 Tax=Lactococcus sp. TaxID=44273 RepID=UPI0035AF91BB
MTQQTPKLVIKSQPQKEARVQLNVSKSVAEQIYGISESVNIGRREVADMLLKFAIDNCEFLDEEE